ncbi:ABC transporter substrate-binding protein [Bailinhaonella thermotolerans]|uniref:Iron-siderophore ABC transporter substrate-binding protein n=1 Tax=Bailinhaonella thermotolerans TaxID=1070861 RepID=A0A3A4AZ90_9ACTN|nr:iron-siderophore ABC transporter substrate-binding protein [Bailinhaonella thermotolerans]RJL32846.1 iron-siderophore ABC transporter substrate-binding protein [Bailinhaonella thermotolerans]
MKGSPHRRPLGRIVAGLAVAAAAFGLAGCGAGSSGGDKAAEGRGAERTVTHAMGTTKITKPVKRVVALDQSFVDAALALETEVVGYTTYRAVNETLPAYLGESARRYGKAAKPVGPLTQPSLEQVKLLKPDLILSAKVRHEQLYGQLSQIAPTVFSETTGAIWKDNLRLVGRALGKEDLAERKIKEYEARAARIGEAIKAGNGGKAPTISILRFTDEPTVRLYVENSYSGIVLKDAGFVRPAGQPTVKDSIVVDVSPERITDLDAEHIFISTYKDEKNAWEKTRRAFETNPLWGKLKGEKHEVEDLTWMSAVGVHGAHAVLDDLAKIFGVDPARAG